MIVQHKELAAGRWDEFRLIEQMAHVGSEVERALNWKAKNNLERSAKAFDRALELLDMTLGCPRNRPRLKEIARAREVCVDFFWARINLILPRIPCEKYFSNCACAARR